VNVTPANSKAISLETTDKGSDTPERRTTSGSSGVEGLEG
jgi:hypothetical protein